MPMTTNRSSRRGPMRKTPCLPLSNRRRKRKRHPIPTSNQRMRRPLPGFSNRLWPRETSRSRKKKRKGKKPPTIVPPTAATPATSSIKGKTNSTFCCPRPRNTATLSLKTWKTCKPLWPTRHAKKPKRPKNEKGRARRAARRAKEPRATAGMHSSRPSRRTPRSERGRNRSLRSLLISPKVAPSRTTSWKVCDGLPVCTKMASPGSWQTRWVWERLSRSLVW
mmetsp:Transcript_12701/g.26927  ORF Transcript_12701/g.26927 Transcript_12701/m.26927 type:complete len:222 (+) Transcript_12701:1-666(+)